MRLLYLLLCFPMFLSNSSFAQPEPLYDEVISGLSRPTDLAFAPGFSQRMYVVEQGGKIKIVEGGQVVSTFLDLSDRLDADSELGLLGLAFDPDFASNGIFYIDYAGRIDGKLQSIIARRFVGDPQDYQSTDREEVVIRFDQPFKNHNAGDISFGPDGMLYVTTGDGGSANDPAGNGQNLDTLLGKLLRIDVRGQETYVIPVDNPFRNQPNIRPEIWAYGLRNPWRIAFDRMTGDLWIGDVGQDKWEEISLVPAGTSGQNFGWKCFEGDRFFSPCDSIQQALPVYVYAHDGNCPDPPFCGESITGGFVYRGPVAEWSGLYFFADYEKKRLWALRYEEGMASQVFNFDFPYSHTSTFGENEAGDLFFATIEGKVYQIKADASTANEVINEAEIALFPNPARTEIELRLPDDQPANYRWIKVTGESSAWNALPAGGGKISVPPAMQGVAWLQLNGAQLRSRIFMVQILH